MLTDLTQVDTPVVPDLRLEAKLSAEVSAPGLSMANLHYWNLINIVFVCFVSRPSALIF